MSKNLTKSQEEPVKYERIYIKKYTLEKKHGNRAMSKN